ncbi:hypothetical protein HK105_201793 [Polyrhizophydium stewartii]|uniref:Ankyrin repeat protein n=1 Tax=Polyrhizophydium stewartii TaxID=2732419 RepID=A0ABR4NFT5_9FUNG
MPAEIQSMILAHAGILTLWLNGRIDDLTNISLDQFKALLCDVFELDWQGDLTKLPFETFEDLRLFKSFWRMHTRSMHARIKALGHNWLGDELDQAAILNGWTDLLNFDRPKELSLSAAECGSISMLEQLVDERKVVTLESGHAEKAAYSGHLEVLKWLHERMPNGSWTTEVMETAAWRGNFDCVKWLHANRTEGCSTGAMDQAALNGHLDIVKWLHANRTEGCTTKAMSYAATYGHLSVVKWLHANRTEGCATWGMDGAAESGHLSVVKWLHANRTEGCTTCAMDGAARNGHLAIVKWLHENRTEGCTKDAMSKAAEEGHADIVEWLHKNRTEGDIADAAMIAAKFGQVAVIQRIHAMAPDAITQNVADEAASFGRVALLDWIVDNTSARPAAREIARALKRKRLRTVVWFRKRMREIFNEHPMSKMDGQSADAVIDWFDQNGLRKDFDQVIQLAINERQIVVLKWLQQHMGDDKWNRTDRERARELVAAA